MVQAVELPSYGADLICVAVSARAQNFTLPMDGATTAEAIAEKRAAEFEAAEAVRLKVRARPSVKGRYRARDSRVAEASRLSCY